MDNILILAQAPGSETPSGVTSEPITTEQTTTTAVPSDPNAPEPQPKMQRSPWTQFLPFVLIFLVMYLLLFRGPKKKQQQHKQMVQSLQKNDRVRTIGGVLGTVVDIRGDEITLKVDESNNTKINVVSSAIGRKLSEDK